MNGIPVAYEVDVCIAGGSTAAVEAALVLAEKGLRLFVGIQSTYLGTDICGPYRYWLEEGEVAQTKLAKAVFSADGNGRQYCPRPMHAKYVLEEALLQAGVSFLYGVYPLQLLEGEGAGVLFGQRNGAFAVRAHAVIDASAIPSLTDDPKHTGEAPSRWRWVTLGGEPVENPSVVTSISDKSYPSTNRHKPADIPVHEYVVEAVDEPGAHTRAETEVRARLDTWSPDIQMSADSLWPVLEHRWQQAADFCVDDFYCESRGIWSLCEETVLARMPLSLAFELGRWVGKQVAVAVRKHGLPNPQTGTGEHPRKANEASLVNALALYRSTSPESLTLSPEHTLDDWGWWDVVVVGGGTGGAPAGVAAAREGARTLVLESLPGLGGVGTLGMISRYWFGNRVGFTEEVDRGVYELGNGKPFDFAGAEEGTRSPLHAWKVEWKMNWYLRELHQAGADVWFRSIACGVLTEEQRVTGLVVATPWGCGIVRCGMVVDATGNSDIAAGAGCACRVLGGEHLAVQGTGLPPRKPGVNARNTDWTFVDETDAEGRTAALVVARHKFRDDFDLGQHIDTRERRQIVGEVEVSPLDILAGRRFPDTITRACSNFDTHGYTVHPVFAVQAPHKEALWADIPFRALVPKGWEGILVTGLGVSAHRDALPVIRMQADVQNQGYAAGIAAARLAATRQATLDLDMTNLQRSLAEKGILTPEDMGRADTFPMDEQTVQRVLQGSFLESYTVAVALSHPGQARPVLRRRYEEVEDEGEKLACAVILGHLGDQSGEKTLLKSLEGEWDAGWAYTGMGQFGPSYSLKDRSLAALVQSRSSKAASETLRLLEALEADAASSHFRFVCAACVELQLGDARDRLAALLGDEKIQGQWQHDWLATRHHVPEYHNDTSTREASLKELYLARALYLLGDKDGLGESVLRAYAKDLRGHFARHAAAVLKAR